LAAKKSKRQKRRADASRGAAKKIIAEESRGAEALTVLWVLSALATLIAETVAAAVAFFALASNDAGGSLLGLLPGLMLFTALVTGALCVGATPLVLRMRATPPPRAVVGIAIVIGVSPWLLLAGWLLRG
jgi:hypothetical protein